METEAPNTASGQGSVVTLSAAGALRCSGPSAVAEQTIPGGMISSAPLFLLPDPQRIW